MATTNFPYSGKGPYEFFRGVMNQGLYSPSEVNQLASGARQNFASQVSGARQETADRAAGMGYIMPYLSGGGGFAPQRTAGAQNAAAQAKLGATMANKQSQMQAGASAGNLASLLSQIAMTPERPDEAPWFASEEAYKDFMAKLNQALSGLTSPLPEINLPKWETPAGGMGSLSATYGYGYGGGVYPQI